MTSSAPCVPTVDDEVDAHPVGPVELAPRNRVGVRASLLAGVPVTGLAAPGYLTFPTVTTLTGA
jgi:hypothetical protein